MARKKTLAAAADEIGSVYKDLTAPPAAPTPAPEAVPAQDPDPAPAPEAQQETAAPGGSAPQAATMAAIGPTPEQEAAAAALGIRLPTPQEFYAWFSDLTPHYEPLSEDINTQGKRGLKLKRINFAFSDANYDYVRLMCGIHRMNMTQYVNKILDEERRRNFGEYVMIKNLVEAKK
jgi:hypothetical protein